MKKLLFIILYIPLISNAQDIITVAGGDTTIGVFGVSRSGPATANSLYVPFGVTLDVHGNLYITTDGFDVSVLADGVGDLYKVSHTGIISTIAGCVWTGGASATSACLGFPTGMAVDNSGNIFIADEGSSCIRKLNDSGVMSIVVGIATFSYTGGYSGDNGPATAAELRAPYGVAINNSGDIYIADEGNHCIRKVDTFGIITTIAGNGAPGYGGDGGPATAAQLYKPYGITVDNSGNIYIADTYNNRIREINSSGIISTIAGSGPVGIGGYSGDGGSATDAELFYPTGIAVDSSGNLYIADEVNNRIREVNTLGLITTIAGTGIAGFAGDGGAATAAELFEPTGVAVDNSGAVYIADRKNNRVRKIIPTCPEPVLGPIAGNDSVYIGSTILLTEILPGGAWVSSDSVIAVVSAGTVTGVTTGVDTIKYILPNDCGTVIAEKIIYVSGSNAATGTSNITTPIPNVTIYPNPAGNELTLTASYEITNITITNLIGQIVCNQPSDAQRVQISVASLSPGVYFVRVNDSLVKKFVKE